MRLASSSASGPSEMIYQIFGSEDSRDCDIIVFVASIGSVAESRVTIESLRCQLQPFFNKDVNVNLAITVDGSLTEVFKGTPDEVNNSLYATYHLHKQAHPQQITKRLPRDTGLKALRSMRAVLSFMSRTRHRAQIKDALSGTAIQKHRLLGDIKFDGITDLGNKNSDMIDFHKMAAFQMGQSMLLNNGIEVYTKADIALHKPALAEFLSRRPDQINKLDDFKELWLRSFDPSNIPEYESLRR